LSSSSSSCRRRRRRRPNSSRALETTGQRQASGSPTGLAACAIVQPPCPRWPRSVALATEKKNMIEFRERAKIGEEKAAGQFNPLSYWLPSLVA